MTEAFSFLDPLNRIPGIRAAWVERIPGVRITGTREEAMTQLRSSHEKQVRAFGGPQARWWRAEQVHGKGIGIVPFEEEVVASDGLPIVPGVDGLVTGQCGQLLAIYVADCGAIWLADQKTRAIGLLHSGKKGTEQDILGEALRKMEEHYGTRPADVTAVLSPCIRPPHYEVDFAETIARQAEHHQLGNFIDCGLNTAIDLERYYSYRMELGQTGRMMAMILRDRD